MKLCGFWVTNSIFQVNVKESVYSQLIGWNLTTEILEKSTQKQLKKNQLESVMKSATFFNYVFNLSLLYLFCYNYPGYLPWKTFFLNFNLCFLKIYDPQQSSPIICTVLLNINYPITGWCYWVFLEVIVAEIIFSSGRGLQNTIILGLQKTFCFWSSLFKVLYSFKGV